MNFIRRVPLLIFILLVYNLVIFIKPELITGREETYLVRDKSASSAPSAPAQLPETETTGTTDPSSPESATLPSQPAGATPSVAAPSGTIPPGFKEVTFNAPPPSLPPITLISGAKWHPTLNDLLLLLAVVLLYLELFKSTKTSTGAIIEHVFSLFVFIIFLIQFLVVEAAGTSTFLIITMLSLIDVIAGFTITISTARRDFGVGHNIPID